MTEKEFFSIKEVADMLDLKPYILRYWEKEFAILKQNGIAWNEDTIQKKTSILSS